VLESHLNSVNKVVFSPDGSKLASASCDKTMRVWNVVTGQVEQTLKSHLDWIYSIVFSPDGSELVLASGDMTVQLWNVAIGQVEKTFKVHSDWISTMNFSDGSTSPPFYTVDTSRCWVTQNGSRVLYLPLDYRPGCITTTSSTLAIGAATGRVTIIAGTN
jgi:WD40 repeat protein